VISRAGGEVFLASEKVSTAVGGGEATCVRVYQGVGSVEKSNTAQISSQKEKGHWGGISKSKKRGSQEKKTQLCFGGVRKATR